MATIFRPPLIAPRTQPHRRVHRPDDDPNLLFALEPPPFVGSGVHLESELDTANVDTYNFIRTISWAAGSPLILTIVNTKGSANANLPVPALTGITWTQANTQLYDGSSAKRVTVFYATPSGSGSGALSVTFGGVVQSNCFYSVEQYVGYDNTTPILQSQIDGVVSPAAAGPWSVTFASALTAGSALQLSGAIDANTTLSQEAGWTQLAQNGNGTPSHRSIVTVSDTGTDTTPSMNASGSHTWAIIAIEIKALAVTSFVSRTMTPQLGPLLAQ